MWCQLTWCKYAVHILPACRERQILHLLQIADFVCRGSDSKCVVVVVMFVQPFEVKDLVSHGSSCCKVVKHNWVFKSDLWHTKYATLIHTPFLCVCASDEREQRSSEVEYLSQAVRAKAEECLAAVDDGNTSSMSARTNLLEGHVLYQPLSKMNVVFIWVTLPDV